MSKHISISLEALSFTALPFKPLLRKLLLLVFIRSKITQIRMRNALARGPRDFGGRPCHAKAKSSGFPDASMLYPGPEGVPENHGARQIACAELILLCMLRQKGGWEAAFRSFLCSCRMNYAFGGIRTESITCITPFDASMSHVLM